MLRTVDIKYLHILKMGGDHYQIDISQSLKWQMDHATIGTRLLPRCMKNRTEFSRLG